MLSWFSAAPAEAATPPPPPPVVKMDGPLRAVRYASLAVLGGYTVSLLYRAGLARRVLPAAANERLEGFVERVKARTRPMGDESRFALVRRHLVATYAWSAAGMATVVGGVLLFCRCPQIPIVLPVAAAVVSAALMMAVPKSMMQPAARGLCFFTAFLSAGYSIGPIGWAAQDSLMVFLMLSGCTMTGLCVPLFLTRGMISYVLSSQLLSLALSLSLVTAPKESKSLSPFKALKAHPGVQVILDGDVNVLLTMQLLSNAAIVAMHTLPVIYRFVMWKGDGGGEEALLDSVDPIKEAFCIGAGWVYVGYRLVRSALHRLITLVLADERGARGKKGAAGGKDGGAPAAAETLMNGQVNVGGVSSVASAVLMALTYVRAVSILQRSNPAETLEEVRSAFAEFSPLTLLLGKSRLQ